MGSNITSSLTRDPLLDLGIYKSQFSLASLTVNTEVPLERRTKWIIGRWTEWASWEVAGRGHWLSKLRSSWLTQITRLEGTFLSQSCLY